MSEILDFKNLDVTEKETNYLFLILLGHDTAYKIYSDLKKEKSISYKNVHERVRKLSHLKLIRQLDIKAKRGAITYEVTSMGLFHLLKNVPILSPFLVTYKKNIILQYLVFRFFEPKTIGYFDALQASMSLREYLSTTCDEILQELEDFRSSKRKDKRETLPRQIDFIIEKNITKFVHTIVTSSYMKEVRVIIHNKEKITGEFDYNVEGLFPEGMKEDSTYSTLFPVKSLKKDQKFISLLKETKEEFEEGCKQFI